MFGPERTYQWLGKDNVPLDFATQVQVDTIRTAIREGDFDLTLDLLDDLKATSGHLDDCAKASVHLECARAYNLIHEPEQAMQELEAADRLLSAIPNPDQCCWHNQAIVNWMLGASFWKAPGQRQQAIQTWQKALGLFQSLTHDPNTLDPAPDWYKDRVTEMQDHLRQALQSPQLIPVRPRPSSRPVTMPRVVLQPGSLTAVNVYGSIQAGTFTPTGASHQPIDRVSLQPSVDEFVIEGNSHHLFNLRGPSRIITLRSSMAYYIMKVNGDSMDKADIDPGDYVLFHYQDTASYGDIVAAQKTGVNTEATLKTYTRVRGPDDKIIVKLMPQSNNQVHEPIPITQSSSDISICGVALGVFKPA